jgi:pilus assembly protein Flp/PilA
VTYVLDTAAAGRRGARAGRAQRPAGEKIFLAAERGMFQKFATSVVDFLAKEDGPTAVEYAVMLALIIVVCIAAITTLGQNANKTFQSVGTSIGSTSS